MLDIKQVNFNNLSDEELINTIDRYVEVYERNSQKEGYMTTVRREDLPRLENYLQRVVFKGMVRGDTRAIELSNKIKSIIDRDGGNILSNPLGFGR